MKKKITITFTLCLIVSAFVYFGIIRRGFSYYTGIGTPYSYFAAKKASNDSILVFYDQSLSDPMFYINDDSLRLKYGFACKYGGTNVSYHVIKWYNSIIKKKLLWRIGNVKWTEYQHKLDSMNKKAAKEFFR